VTRAGPYHCWTRLRWNGDVMIATDPDGREWSIGEILRDQHHRVVAVEVLDPTHPRRLLARVTVRSVRTARCQANRAFNGAKWAPELSARARAVVALLRERGPMRTSELCEALGCWPSTLGAAVQEARAMGLVKHNGRATSKRRWFARGAR
jgi:hypothetical protein